MDTTIRKRSVTIAGHATSVSLEEAFWEALKALAQQRNVSVTTLIEQVDDRRTGNLSSAIRVFVLEALLARRGTEPATNSAAGTHDNGCAHV
jgi:predicted DNA-binding ribbon-helix-helix protein